MKRVVKLVDDRFTAGVASIVGQSYNKALKLSDQLAEDVAENTRRQNQSKIQRLEEIVADPANRIYLSANNSKFLAKSKARLEKIQMRSQEMSRMGANNLKDILIGDLKRSTGKFNMLGFMQKSSAKWMHLQFQKFGQRRIDYMLNEAERLKNDAEDANRIIGPSGFLEKFNKSVSIAILPIVWPLQKIVTNMPTIRKIGGFATGIFRGVRNIASLGLNAIRKTVSLGIGAIRSTFALAKGIITAPFATIGKIFGFLNRPFGKQLLEFISGDTGAMFLATASAFLKVFVLDYIFEKIGFIKEFSETIKGKFEVTKDIAQKYVTDPWMRRLFSGQNWSLKDDESAIKDFDSRRTDAYQIFKKKNNDNFTRYRNYLMAQAYGAMQVSLMVNLNLKKFYDNMFPYRESDKVEKSERELQMISDTEGYNSLLGKHKMMDHVEIYAKIASDYVEELTKGFDIGKFIDRGATNGKNMVNDL